MVEYVIYNFIQHNKIKENLYLNIILWCAGQPRETLKTKSIFNLSTIGAVNVHISLYNLLVYLRRKTAFYLVVVILQFLFKNLNYLGIKWL